MKPFQRKNLSYGFPSPKYNPDRLYPLFCFIFVLAGLALLLAGFVPLSQRLFCPFQVNQGEAINVEFSRIFLRGGALYHDPNMSPYINTTYPPLFPILQGWLSLLIPGTWLAGRLLAFAGYLGCALALLTWGLRHWPAGPSMALAVLFLLSPTWATWGSIVRVDCFVTALVFTAFLLLRHTDRLQRKNPGKIYWFLTAGFLTALAVLSKQNAVLLALAYGLTCLFEKRWKDMLLFGTAFVCPSLVSVIFLQHLSHGFYWKQTVLWVPEYGFQPSLLSYYIKTSFLPECGWLLAGVIVTALWKKTSLLSKCQVLLTLLFVMGMARKTSAENYYLDFILYGLFFLGEGWFSPEKAFNQKVGMLPFIPQSKWINAALNSKFIFLIILVWGFFSFSSRPWPWPPSRTDIGMKMQALGLYRAKGEYLALDLDLPLLAGKRLWIQPAEYTALVEKGYWSPSSLIRDIREKKFVTIELYDIPQQYLLPADVVEEINRSYRVFLRGFGREWFAPKKD